MRKILSLSILIALASSCAQVLTPDGGPKDRTPPKVVSYSPDSAATNFTGKKIVIHFNEYIQLKDIQNQLIISPPLNHDPEVTIRKKDIVIELKDTLLPNTTYSISFGNSIHDITEDNIVDNFRYVFSTGPVIDSLRISGKLVNASTLAGEKGIYVMLYSETGDSVPLKNKPYYFTKTKPDGSFVLTNLRAGTYKVFALDDKNSNYRFDNSSERIAFSDQLLQLSKNNDSLNLKLFMEEPVKQTLIKATQPGPGRLTFAFAMPLGKPKVTFSPKLPSEMEMFNEISVTRDTLDFWFSTVTLDSLTFFVSDETTGFKDTLTLQLAKPGTKNKHSRSGGTDPVKLQFVSNIQSGQDFDLGKQLQFTSNNPLKNVNTKNIFLLKGKDTIATDISLSENKRFLVFKNVFEEDSSYSIFIKPGAVTDWFGQKNDSVKMNFHIQKSGHYGTLKAKLSGLPSGNYILQVVNDKDVVLRETKITDAKEVDFDLLSPGQYRLKLIADANKNGKWDTGNYLQHKQPEKIIYYINPVRMRAGWDMEVEWNFK
jgi:uncharacterized protein (DUF2141 family)